MMRLGLLAVLASGCGQVHAPAEDPAVAELNAGVVEGSTRGLDRIDDYCSGVFLSPAHVLTARNCGHFDRVSHGSQLFDVVSRAHSDSVSLLYVESVDGVATGDGGAPLQNQLSCKRAATVPVEVFGWGADTRVEWAARLAAVPLPGFEVWRSGFYKGPRSTFSPPEFLDYVDAPGEVPNTTERLDCVSDASSPRCLVGVWVPGDLTTSGSDFHSLALIAPEDAGGPAFQGDRLVGVTTSVILLESYDSLARDLRDDVPADALTAATHVFDNEPGWNPSRGGQLFSYAGAGHSVPDFQMLRTMMSPRGQGSLNATTDSTVFGGDVPQLLPCGASSATVTQTVSLSPASNPTMAERFLESGPGEVLSVRVVAVGGADLPSQGPSDDPISYAVPDPQVQAVYVSAGQERFPILDYTLTHRGSYVLSKESVLEVQLSDPAKNWMRQQRALNRASSGGADFTDFKIEVELDGPVAAGAVCERRWITGYPPPFEDDWESYVHYEFIPNEAAYSVNCGGDR